MFSDLMGERHPITFSLAEPIVFADSKTTHGIQLADAAAAAAVYAFAAPEMSKQSIGGQSSRRLAITAASFLTTTRYV